MDKPIKTLRQEGVPLGARLVFRAQYVGFLLACAVILLSLPALFMWGLVHPSGLQFVNGATEVIRAKGNRMREHRAKVIRMYAGREA